MQNDNNNETTSGSAQMWTGIVMVILGILLTPVLIGIPMIIVGFWYMIAGVMKD